MSKKDLRKYYYGKKPSGAIVLLIFGILLFLLGASIDDAFLWAIIGVLMIGGGICLIVNFGKKHSDSTVDSFCNTLAEEYYATKRSIAESKENKITDSICSCGYCFDNIFSARKIKKGRDDISRSSIFNMFCLFFSDETVYCYCKKISLITDEKTENEKSFQIQDIQMVSLEEINQSVNVVVSIPGNENIYVGCKNKEEAIKLCDKIKSLVYKRKNM